MSWACLPEMSLSLCFLSLFSSPTVTKSPCSLSEGPSSKCVVCVDGLETCRLTVSAKLPSWFIFTLKTKQICDSVLPLLSGPLFPQNLEFLHKWNEWTREPNMVEWLCWLQQLERPPLTAQVVGWVERWWHSTRLSSSGGLLVCYIWDIALEHTYHFI